MSYIPFRDNPDLAGVGEITQAALEQLSDRIDESATSGLHVDQCNCDRGEDCSSWSLGYQGSTEEALGWLVGQGLLDANAVVRWLAENKR